MRKRTSNDPKIPSSKCSLSLNNCPVQSQKKSALGPTRIYLQLQQFFFSNNAFCLKCRSYRSPNLCPITAIVYASRPLKKKERENNGRNSRDNGFVITWRVILSYLASVLALFSGGEKYCLAFERREKSIGFLCLLSCSLCLCGRLLL
ncbi:hypothetical protein TNCT_310141 [Trichonephila clavata]|uniref:Uncharacterized protein n=1 Tax=Trichonephila clavata TaxID=2740835 RepID=A0A8X6G9A3_TRICU|nr:hypothetical protein TNCT_310141 [Trichonephila clavata]